MLPVSVFQRFPGRFDYLQCNCCFALLCRPLFVSFVLQVSNSESTQQQMSFLNKQLLLLGEAHKLSMVELQHTGKDDTKVWCKQVLSQFRQMQHTELKNRD